MQDPGRGMARLILGVVVGAALVGVPFTIQYQSLSSEASDLRFEVSDLEEVAEAAEQDAEREEISREKAETELTKLKREAAAASEEVLAALEEASTLIDAQRAHIFDLEGQLARARQRPTGARCTDGISGSELATLEMDPCSEWSFDY